MVPRCHGAGATHRRRTCAHPRRRLQPRQLHRTQQSQPHPRLARLTTPQGAASPPRQQHHPQSSWVQATVLTWQVSQAWPPPLALQKLLRCPHWQSWRSYWYALLPGQSGCTGATRAPRPGSPGCAPQSQTGGASAHCSREGEAVCILVSDSCTSFGQLHTQHLAQGVCKPRHLNPYSNMSLLLSSMMVGEHKISPWQGGHVLDKRLDDL